MIRTGSRWGLLAILAAGCAARPGPSAELMNARAALVRARAIGTTHMAREDLHVAERALEHAEREQRLSPGTPEARDSAYIAGRAAERARVAGFLAADRETLASARASLQRLRKKIEQRAADTRARSRMLADALKLREEQRRTLEVELERAKGNQAELKHNDAGALSLRVSTHRLFFDGQALLRPAGVKRLKAIADALGAGPPSQVQIVVVDDDIGETMGAARLARRRADRIREFLEQQGLPGETFTTPFWSTGPESTATLEITERPVVVPPSTVSLGP